MNLTYRPPEPFRRDWALYALVALLFGNAVLSVALDMSLIRRIQAIERRFQWIDEKLEAKGW